MNRMKALLGLALLALIIIGAWMGIAKGDNPGIEYAPNMYVSDAYEPYSQEQDFEGGYTQFRMTMGLPVPGAIARGQVNYVYPHPNTGEGYEASASFTSWLPKTKSNIKEGERLYVIYCSHCHGKSGKNDGSIFAEGKIPPPPWSGYTDPIIQELPEGKIYHTITHGKGLMGSHAAMLTPNERWMVIDYVKYLSLGENFEFDPESASSSMNATSDASGNASSGTTLTPEMKTSIKSLMAGILFKGVPNRREMVESSFANLDKIAAMLKSAPGTMAVISGHTGLTLSDEAAESLGKDRANAVAAYLINKGVSSANLRVVSKGSADREGDAATAEGRQANRRVEIEFLNK